MLKLFQFFRKDHVADTERLGILSAIFAALFMSSYSVIGKPLLETFQSHTLAAVGQLISALALLLIFGMYTELKMFMKLSSKEKIWITLVGLLSALVAPFLMLTGLKDTTATNTVLISTTESIIGASISAIWLKETISRNQIWGSLLIIIGIIVIITQMFTKDFSFNGGDFYILLAAFSWSLSSNMKKKYLSHTPSEFVVVVRTVVGSLGFLFLLPIIFEVTHELPPNIFESKETLTLLVMFALFPIILAPLLWYNSLEAIPANKASNILMINPVFGVTLAVLFLGETLELHHIIGGLLAVVGLWFSIQHHKDSEHHDFVQKTRNFH